MNRTPEELKILAETQAALEAGGDPFGDDEELVRDEADATPPGDTDTDPDADDASAKPDVDPDAAQDPPEGGAATPPADPPKPDPDPLGIAEQPRSEQPAMFETSLPADYKEQRTKLMTDKGAALKKLMDGEIDAEAYALEESRIADALDELTSLRIRAETLQQANVQNQAAYEGREIKKLIAATKSEVDYMAEPTARKQFDIAMDLVRADPENAGLDYSELIQQAHKSVAALRGVQLKNTTAAPPAAPAPPPDRRPDGKAPQTLRDVPAASLPNTGGGVLEQLGHLKGQAYEDAFSKLTPAQRASMLDE